VRSVSGKPATGHEREQGVIMLHLMTSTGTTVSLPRMAQAQSGPHMGTWWKLTEIVKRDSAHHVRATRKHRAGRHTITVLPEIFGMRVHETLNVIKDVARSALNLWRKIDEGLYMGVLALVPLAYFERYDGAEWITETINEIVEGEIISSAVMILPVAVLIATIGSLVRRTVINRRQSKI
jgi:hypothetical protein